MSASAISSLLGSDVWLLVVLGASFLTAFMVAMMLLGVREKGRRRRSLARLIGRRSASDEEQAPKSGSRWMPVGLISAGERVASAGGFSARLDQRLEQGGLPFRAGEFVALTTVCAIAGGVFGAIVLPNVAFVLLVAAVAGLLPYFWVVRAHRKRQRAIVDQLGDVLAILASSLRAGHSFLQALDMVAKEIGEPSAGEFQRVVTEIRLGRPVDDALLAMAERIDSEDLKWAVIAVNIQREVGGNLAEVLDIVANTVRERAYVRRQVRVLSAEGRISISILSVLPFLIFLYIAIVNPTYLNPLFSTMIGRFLLVVGGALMGMGIYVMTRMVKIDV